MQGQILVVLRSEESRTASCWFGLALQEREKAMTLSQLTFPESEHSTKGQHSNKEETAQSALCLSPLASIPFSSPTLPPWDINYIFGFFWFIKATRQKNVFLKWAYQTYIIEKQLGAYTYWCNNRYPERMTSQLLPESAGVQLSIEDVCVLWNNPKQSLVLYFYIFYESLFLLNGNKKWIWHDRSWIRVNPPPRWFCTEDWCLWCWACKSVVSWWLAVDCGGTLGCQGCPLSSYAIMSRVGPLVFLLFVLFLLEIKCLCLVKCSWMASSLGQLEAWALARHTKMPIQMPSPAGITTQD